ncbi:DUF397 domain-containing protein [Streptomyces europaeiscabiei]|uniref:DUF397 domain-containing protein n=1 Tax=Streptomyces europaeiscabiei TaxID=146819 RepID=A0ABU4NCJ7_9ACTN|nr:DUF397 domain-containing protein [Streptomyces europaeiscabiei]MDX2525550.1 DUF397 domain-containing protein [Streptomyces europaeiscabiei]MDX3542909.1 DUF397 domain-containing protein [Streptomyces europaeiscabiei]MDX3552725.1 DUF397 domain-containing protein [Streptomyces europaeiscabiei]MDX3667448.1 DUF397 domain-containing protein [Streptomyces europaeiscabiei]MDX3700831.1 DUF397 domain-containing protein [Streptomyces europaeiscabiei]
MIHKAVGGDTSELAWFKSSYSGGTDGNSCVEVAATPGTVHVRDSKDIRLPRLTLTSTAWADFVSYAVEG